MSGIVDINPPTQESRGLWAKALEVSRALGPDEQWTLIGGLMVQLHAYEHRRGSRLTADIDFLGDSRRRPPMTERIAEVLIQRGGEMAMPPSSDERLGYKFEVDGEVIEILGSEGVRSDPKTLGRYTTIQVPGGTQALTRSEIVRVSLDGGEAVDVRRPSLLGAVLIKARAVAKRRDKFESDRQDLIRLLSFVEDPREMAKALRSSERKWLSAVGPTLAFDDSALTGLFSGEEAALAEQAYQLLVS